ncbi:MAG: peroxiredoxin family protein [Planctomycetaceae bacterium]
MRYTGVLVAGLLLVFGLNASHAFLLPESGAKSVQEKEKAEDQKKGDDEEKESDEKESDSSDKEEAKAEEAKADKAQAAVDAVKAIAEEFDTNYKKFLEFTKTKDFRKEYAKASEEGREAARAYLTKVGMPDAEKYSKKMEEVAAVSMAFIAMNSRDRAKSSAAMDYLFENHADSEIIESVIDRAGMGVPAKKAKARFRAAMKGNPSEKVQGLAAIGLAEMMAEEELDDTTEVEELFQTVIDKYASIESRGSTLGERAEKALFVMKYLRIGAVAPDIKAEDIDGVEFKLSDYRGKVVLLDFWGNW